MKKRGRFHLPFICVHYANPGDRQVRRRIWRQNNNAEIKKECQARRKRVYYFSFFPPVEINDERGKVDSRGGVGVSDANYARVRDHTGLPFMRHSRGIKNDT